MTITQGIELDEFLSRYRRAARRIRPAREINPGRPRKFGALHRRRADIEHTPQAVCKLISKLKRHGNLRRAIDYITQNDNIELIDRHGNRITGPGWGALMAQQWINENKIRAELNGRKQRRDAVQAVHLMFSSPKDSTLRQNETATRALLQQLFPRHDYLLAQHTDTPHLHTHVILNNVSDTGQPLSWRKARLLTLRETWAGQQQRAGVHVTCSPRNERAQFTPSLAMAQVKARARGEPLHIDERNIEEKDKQAWLIKQVAAAYQQYLILQQDLKNLRKKRNNDRRAAKTREKTERYLLDLITKTRQHVRQHTTLQLPDWLQEAHAHDIEHRMTAAPARPAAPLAKHTKTPMPNTSDQPPPTPENEHIIEQ